jgi:peptide/nickel transport system substrate-binding protein
VRKSLRVLLGAIVTVAVGTGGTLWATSAGAAHSAAAPTVTILYGTAPDYIDPQRTYTTQGGEATWITWLGLYTYAHKSGVASGDVIPALATAAPVVTNGGKTYTMTLRKNLVYSNGAKVKASDFTYSIERALKLTWGGDSFYTGNIVGALAYSKGTSKTISGIVTNNATGTVTIHLLAPYGPFLNILAFPSSGFVPTGTAMTTLTNNPPPGVGPYKIIDVVPDKSWVGAINPYYAKEAIPGIPQGTVTVDAKVESNTATETEDVLNNTADLFDTGDQPVSSLVPQIKSQAANRYSNIPVVQNFYFFLNVTEKPFNNAMVREAVDIAIDRRVLSKLEGANLTPGCFFLPAGMPGHPTAPCPYGINPNAAPNLAKAKALIKASGDAGAAVTVYSEERVPRTQFCQYYASVLNQIGLKATIKPIADTLYFPTIGTLKLHPQTGFADWDEDFPNPADFYLLLDKASITPTNGLNYGQVDDPTIQSGIAKLDPVPSSKLNTVVAAWQKLDEYTAAKAYNIVFGYQNWPKFTSTRIDYSKLLIQPSYGWDWTSIHIKS